MSKLTATRKELLQTTKNKVAVAQERQKSSTILSMSRHQYFKLV